MKKRIIPTNEKESWQKYWVPAIFALLGALLGVLGADLGSPYRAELLKIRTTQTREAELTQSANSTVVAGRAIAARITPSLTPVPPTLTPTPTVTLGPSPTLAPTYYYDQPQFDINVISYTTQTDTLEITNNMLNGADEMVKPENEYGVASANLRLEIRPYYFGDYKYGEVSLRVSGPGGAQLTRPLWDHFSKSSDPLKVELTLRELIDLSGVKYRDDAPATNVQAGKDAFPAYPLTLEVIAATDPAHPFPGKKVISVVNTPWLQYTRLAWREGRWVIDYYTKNLGRDGYFGYNLDLVKTVRPVNDDSHPVWSGTDQVQSGPNSKLFFLKKGEERLESIPLRDDLKHGRYIAQVYTYKVPEFVTFRSKVDWPGYDYDWMFASPGDRLVFVLCNDPGQGCSQTFSEPIEQHGVTVYPYAGLDSGKSGWTYYTASVFPTDDYLATRHTVKYEIDPGQEGWAGIAIAIESWNDFSRFHYLRFDFQLIDADNNGSEPPVWMDIVSVHPDTKEKKWTRIKLADGKYGKNTTELQTIVVPLKDLTSTDLAHITEINLVSDNTLVPDNAAHSFSISSIAFFDTTK